jgi:hypothetical protein
MFTVSLRMVMAPQIGGGHFPLVPHQASPAVPWSLSLPAPSETTNQRRMTKAVAHRAPGASMFGRAIGSSMPRSSRRGFPVHKGKMKEAMPPPSNVTIDFIIYPHPVSGPVLSPFNCESHLVIYLA